MKENERNELLIPFVKPARVGNFKLWRSKINLGGKKDKTEIECVNVSNLEGSWTVRIPSTSTLFSVIVSNYATIDTDLREQFLAGEVLSNLEVLNTSGSVILHHAFRLLFQALSYPIFFMTEKEVEDWVKSTFKSMDKKQRKQHLDNLLKERREFYDLVEKERNDYISTWKEQHAMIKDKEDESQKQLEQDEIAEQAIDVLNKEGDN